MAVQKVPVSGAVIKIKANGGSAAAVVMNCIEGTWDIDLGDYDVNKIECSGGVDYEKGNLPNFGTATWKGKFDGVMTNEAQILLLQGLYNQGDFIVDNTMNVEITFPIITVGGTSGTIYNYNVIIKSGKCPFDPKGKLGLDFVVQQVDKLVMTAAV